MRDLPGAREVDDPDDPARDRVVYRRAGTDPFAIRRPRKLWMRDFV